VSSLSQTRLKHNGTRCNVSDIAEQQLCNSCGACSVVCPVNAIGYEETVGGRIVPHVDEGRCTSCGLCFSVCPGVHFGKTLSESVPLDPFIGEALGCFVGRAVDEETFLNSQSGGVVTALLLDALQEERIQAAVVVSMKPGKPPKPEALLATTEEQIVAAQKSKYGPIPLLHVLRDVEEQGLSVAVVGLPCHLHGLHNLIDVRPSIREHVIFTVGLICDRIMTMAGRDFLIARSGLGGELRDLRFRDKSEGGWPGSVKVVSMAGQSAVLPAGVRLSIKDAFTPARCRLCFDKLNVFADVTVGDPWGIASADKINGESVAVVRTARGSELLKGAVDCGAVVVRPIQYEEVIEGQKIDQRRRDWRDYREAWRRLGLELPDYYERVAECAPAAAKRGGHYRRQLRRALSLDGFRSREALLRHVERSLFLRRWRRRLLLPIRVARGIIRRTTGSVRSSAASLGARIKGST
jgi:coenzyme F420 hydrogenase subunit beta